MTCGDKYQLSSFYQRTVDLIQKKQIGSWTTFFTNAQMFHIHSFLSRYAAEHAIQQSTESADVFYAKINEMEQRTINRSNQQKERVAMIYKSKEQQEQQDDYNPEVWEDPCKETDVDEEEYFNSGDQATLREQMILEKNEHHVASSWLLAAQLATANGLS